MRRNRVHNQQARSGQLQTVRYDLQFSVSGRSDEHQWLGERVSDIDIDRCPHCGGQLKLIAAIEEPAVIQRIHIHLGLAARTGRGIGSVSGGFRPFRVQMRR